MNFTTSRPLFTPYSKSITSIEMLAVSHKSNLTWNSSSTSKNGVLISLIASFTSNVWFVNTTFGCLLPPQELGVNLSWFGPCEVSALIARQACDAFSGEKRIGQTSYDR